MQQLLDAQLGDIGRYTGRSREIQGGAHLVQQLLDAQLLEAELAELGGRRCGRVGRRVAGRVGSMPLVQPRLERLG